jgi:hypothetical protein
MKTEILKLHYPSTPSHQLVINRLDVDIVSINILEPNKSASIYLLDSNELYSLIHALNNEKR